MTDNTATRPILAAFCALSAMALFGLIDNYVKIVAAEGGLWQFHFMRAIVALVALVVIATALRTDLRPQKRAAVAARSALISLAMVIYFGCLGLMPIAQAVAGLFTAPMWVVVFSVLFFGVRIGIFRVLAVMLGFAGILLVIRPDPANLSLLTFVPVLAGALYAMGNVATRQWCEGEATLVLLGGFFVAMVFWGGLGLIYLTLQPWPVAEGAGGFITRGWVSPSPTFWFWIFVQGVGSLLGIGLTIRAYQLGEASYVAVFEYSLIVFAGLWAWALWDEVPDRLALIGIAMILASGTIIALRSGSSAKAGSDSLAA